MNSPVETSLYDHISVGRMSTSSLTRCKRKDPLTYIDYTSQVIDVCLADGVSIENKDRAGASWWVFGLNTRIYEDCHMIWVSNQQLAIPREHLQPVNMEWHSETMAFAATFDDETKSRFRDDVISGLPTDRLLPAPVHFDQSVAIKMHSCGCSARWMFGMSRKKAIEDLELHISKLHDPN